MLPPAENPRGARPDTVPNGAEAGARTARAALLLDQSLTGRLPCVTCRYDLQGLSILGVCPECGTAVRATILAVVDPMAEELRPVHWPRLTAAGLLVWIGAGLLATLVVWSIVATEVSAGWSASVELPRSLLTTDLPTSWRLVAGLLGLSGVGAMALVAPHTNLPRRNLLAAVCGVLLYIPLCVLALGAAAAALTPGMRAEPLFWAPMPERTGWRVLAMVLVLTILVLLRPNARMLVARSLAIRTGRVDRQTLLAMAAAVGTTILGDILGFAGLAWGRGGGRGDIADAVATLGAVLMLMGGVLLTVGLTGSLVDAMRIARAIVAPGPTMEQVLGTAKADGTGAKIGTGSGGA